MRKTALTLAIFGLVLTGCKKEKVEVKDVDLNGDTTVTTTETVSTTALPDSTDWNAAKAKAEADWEAAKAKVKEAADKGDKKAEEAAKKAEAEAKKAWEDIKAGAKETKEDLKEGYNNALEKAKAD